MNSLALILGGLTLMVVVVISLCHLRWERQHLAVAGVLSQSEKSQPLVGWGIPLTLIISLIIVSLLIYGKLGRFGDWDSGFDQARVNYLLQANLNQSQMAVREAPEDPYKLMQLAHDFAAGGKYADAVQSLEQAQGLMTETAELLGFKAKYLYYRDGRVLGMEATAAASRALQLDKQDFTTRELLASHAFRQKDYQTAIEHWQVIVDSGRGGRFRHAIESAITRAQAKLLTQQQ